jgi:multiple sugar transport system permease protein
MSSFFSPITERSLSVRLLYATLFVVLTIGALTMIIPFTIMIAGSLETTNRFSDSVFFPRYLVDRNALWQRYLEAKYHGIPDFLRMAWNDPEADFRTARLAPDAIGTNSVGRELWCQFLAENPQASHLTALGFLRSNRRIPAYYGREFRLWLMDRFSDDIDKLNAALDTQFPSSRLIFPPTPTLIGANPIRTPLYRAFEDFSDAAPDDRKFAWDAGGYYRAVYLPRLLGPDIAAFNKSYGTHYASYAEVPFSAAAPSIAADLWFQFATRVLRSDLISLSPSGESRRAESGLPEAEFIQTRARPEDLRVDTLDRKFSDWVRQRTGHNALIPQRQLDLAAFESESGFWKRTFATLNYHVVIDEIVLNGRALTNTLILVALSVVGALIVNPLAAYALSRFRLRKTYHILLFFLVTIAFPAEVTMIPVFLQMREFNLLNTFGALVLPGLANGFSIFLLKGFFDSLPKELYEAGEIDGASEWTMFWLVTMNLSKPILAVIALGAFVSAYGTFFYALVLAPDPNMWTLMVYIYQLRQMMDSPVVYASLILTAFPTLLVFIFCQNIILRGIVVPTEK